MSNNRQGTNYYEILEVERDAPQNEIHQAYQRAKATYSTDNPALYSMFSKEEARELSRMIEEAYSVLGNHTARKSYDDSLTQMPAARPAQNVAPVQTYSTPQTTTVHTPSADLNAGDSIGDSYIVRKREAPTSSLPPGTARTALSTYKIDESLEASFRDAEDWDGKLIAKVRNYKGVGIEQVSEATRISKTYLNALEANDYKKLPAPVFVRGFVVQVARILGLNENKVASSYIKILKATTGQ